jgi:flagellar basal-body rod protein FlgB
VLDDILTPKSADGNNVNMELEMTGLMQNRLQYELYSTILAGRMELMRSAIQGGR